MGDSQFFFPFAPQEKDIHEEFEQFSSVINEWQTQYGFVHIQKVTTSVIFIIALIAVVCIVMEVLYNGMELIVAGGLLCLFMAVLWYWMRQLGRLPPPKIIMSHI